MSDHSKARSPRHVVAASVKESLVDIELAEDEEFDIAGEILKALEKEGYVISLREEGSEQ